MQVHCTEGNGHMSGFLPLDIEAYDTPSFGNYEEHRQEHGLEKGFERNESHYQILIRCLPELLLAAKCDIHGDDQ